MATRRTWTSPWRSGSPPGCAVGDRSRYRGRTDSAPIAARIVAIDSRVDPATRNALVRARIADASGSPSPGASVRVLVPAGPPGKAVAIPVSALRKGPEATTSS